MTPDFFPHTTNDFCGVMTVEWLIGHRVKCRMHLGGMLLHREIIQEHHYILSSLDLM